MDLKIIFFDVWPNFRMLGLSMCYRNQSKLINLKFNKSCMKDRKLDSLIVSRCVVFMVLLEKLNFFFPKIMNTYCTQITL